VVSLEAVHAVVLKKLKMGKVREIRADGHQTLFYQKNSALVS
jgi:hypothetical protein